MATDYTPVTGAGIRAALEQLLGPIDWDAVKPVEPYDGPLPAEDYEFEVIR